MNEIFRFHHEDGDKINPTETLAKASFGESI